MRKPDADSTISHSDTKLLGWCAELAAGYAEAGRISDPFVRRIAGEMPLETVARLCGLWERCDQLCGRIEAAYPRTDEGRRARARAVFMHEAQTVCEPSAMH